MSEHMGMPLSVLCVNVGNNKRNNFTVMDKDGRAPIKTEVSDVSLFTSCQRYLKIVGMGVI